MSLSPLFARRHGLVIESLHSGRQLAWVRLSTGGWLALVTIEARTADGLNSLTMGKHQDGAIDRPVDLALGSAHPRFEHAFDNMPASRLRHTDVPASP